MVNATSDLFPFFVVKQFTCIRSGYTRLSTLMDVVEKGNRQMHGIDRYVDLITSGETIRISSKEALIVVQIKMRPFTFIRIVG